MKNQRGALWKWGVKVERGRSCGEKVKKAAKVKIKLHQHVTVNMPSSGSDQHTEVMNRR